MTRKLKVLGLALVAVLALCAASASADDFTAAKSPLTLTGTQVKGDVFSTTFGELECEEATYSGTLNVAHTDQITITPKYSKCFVAEIIPVTVDMNSCDYIGTINPIAGKTNGWGDIACTKAGDDITITVGGPGTVKCTIHVTQQTVNGITYSNAAGGKVTIEIHATGITYTETEGTGLGHCNTSKEAHDGAYDGHEIFSGEEEPPSSGAVAISVS